MAGPVRWLEKVLKPDSDPIAASIGWLEKFLVPEPDQAERRRVDQFAAYRWNGSTLTQEMVRDVSSTGLYLLTRERWQPGTILALTLQREGAFELDRARRITTHVKVIRCGTDGVGLSFLWSKDDPASRQWESLLESLIDQTKPADMRSLVRMVEAFSFLGRICSGGAEEIGEWVRTRASSHKVLNAISIALHAEGLQGASRPADRARINPHIAVRILDVGSGTDEDWLHQFWAGILITSVSVDGRRTANLEFVELLSQLTSIPLRIFTVVCTRAPKVVSASGAVAATPLACDLQELATTVGSRVPQMERDIETLSGFKLIERRRTMNGPALLANNEIQIAPTSLGLQLFALCNGHRGDLRDFYSLHSSASVGARN